MIVTQNTKLNVVPGGIIPVVHVSQYDVDREISFTLYDGNGAAVLDNGTTVSIDGTKPDGHGFSYEGTLTGNVASFATTQQMTVLVGAIECKLTLRKDSQVIGTAMFILDVEKAGLGENTDISDTEIPMIVSLATEQMERAEAAAVSAGQSAIVAGSAMRMAGSFMRIAGESAESAQASAVICSSILPIVRGYKESAEQSAVICSSAVTISGLNKEDSEAWAVGKRNGSDVPSTDPTYHNNSKYYAGIAEQYAQGGLIYKGSVLFANIPVSGMSAGDLYNIQDDFTTDSRFEEGAGVKVKAGTDIAWNGTKWDVLATGGAGGHEIINSAGTLMTQRAKLKFLNSTITDDALNDMTIINPFIELTGISKIIGDTTVTFTDSAIQTTSELHLLSENSGNTPVFYTAVTASSGSVTYTFPALTEATTFYLQIKN